MTVSVRSFGKVNLFLSVKGLRPDGYHEVETVLHGIDLGDDLVFTLTSTGRVEVIMGAETSTGVPMPTAEENLVRRAAARLAAMALPPGPAHPGSSGEGRLGADGCGGIHIEVVKRIPIGAGLGGGSADAAATLLTLDDLLGLELGPRALQETAREMGVDVPFCLTGGTALATARGDDLTVLHVPAALHFILGISFQPLLTPDVYKAFDELDIEREADSASIVQALGAGDVGEIAGHLHNDLEQGAISLRPELATQKQDLLDSGALGACVSGSGPTIFAIAADAEDAASIARRVEGSFDAVRVVGSRKESLQRLD